MFFVIGNICQLNFSQLMDVYSESNQLNASNHYTDLDAPQSILETEQDQYAFLRAFFRLPGAFLAVWAPDGVYKAALRAEPYMDGFLIEGLETAPDSRRQGHATMILGKTAEYLSGREVDRVYSHIHKKNIASIKAHESCGFVKLQEHAAFVDGSVDHHTFTYVKTLKKQGAVG